MTDDPTLAYYDAQAGAFAARRIEKYADQLGAFIEKVGRGARVLDLGCGAGHDAELMLQGGLDVLATDGSAQLVALAQERLGCPVRVMRFEELDEHEAFDGVWANRSLLHVRLERLPDVLARIWRALKPGAAFFASFKAGEGGALDAAGRYYNFPSRKILADIYAQGGAWSELRIEMRDGADHDDVPRQWLLCNAVKASA